VLADMVADGVNPLEVLDLLDRMFGAHVQENFSLRIDPKRSSALQSALLNSTASLAGLAVVSAEDLEHDPLRPGRGVRLRLTGTVLTGDDTTGDATGVVRVRVVVRPSGTEPKTKVYVEAVCSSRLTARTAALSVRAAIEHLAD
jgi:phosphomannomutase